jgi:hypothetical protein
MTDWAKLTVAKLKEACAERDVSVTGLKLKQQFVDKLSEWETQHGAPHEAEAQEERAQADGKVDTVEQNGHANGASTSAAEQAQGGLPDTNGETKSADDQAAATGAPSEVGSAQPKATQEPATETAPDKTAPEAFGDEQHGSTAPVSTQNALETPEAPAEKDASMPPPTGQSTRSSSVLTPAEAQEDSRKRKRRSVTPPPQAEEVALKRAKANDGSPVLRTNEEKQEEQPKDAKDPNADASPMTDTEGAPESSQSRKRRLASTTPPPEADEFVQKRAKGNDGTPVSRVVEEKQEEQKAIEEAGVDADAGPLAHNEPRLSNDSVVARSYTESPPQQKARSRSPASKPELDDHITPSIHPATAALYIRNFKRPLRSPDLQAYISSIAKPSDPDSNSVKYLYLDSLRTHAFVVLDSISSASRVRVAMHNIRWPDEPTREPLWADFIPEDKAEAWANQELDSSTGNNFGGGRSAPAKRWEIIYPKDAEGILTAVLQDANAPGSRRQDSYTQQSSSQRGSFAPPTGPRQPSYSNASAAAPDGAGVHPDRAAMLPRDRSPARKPSEADRAQAERNFAPLNSLFPSTDAKPKLYYKPVSQDLVEQRLKRLRSLKVGHDGMGKSGQRDMKRYSFEKDDRGKGEYWVDKGPEFGFGQRGRERLAGDDGRRGGGYGGGKGGGGGRGARYGTYSPPPRPRNGGGGYQDWDAPPVNRRGGGGRPGRGGDSYVAADGGRDRRS